MPIYEYGCEKCGKTFEYMQAMSDGPKTECEECGGSLRKLISSTSFQLKGGGWYKDLYSSSKPGASAGSDKPSAGAGGSPSREGKPKSDSSKGTSPAKTAKGDS